MPLLRGSRAFEKLSRSTQFTLFVRRTPALSCERSKIASETSFHGPLVNFMASFACTPAMLLPQAWDQPIADSCLVRRIPRQLSSKQMFLVKQPPDEERQHESEPQEAPV